MFVTKDGEIVYALPDGRVETSPMGRLGRMQGSRGVSIWGKVVLGWYGQAPLVRAESEFVVANAYSPFYTLIMPIVYRIVFFAKSLIAAHLPGLLVETTDGSSVIRPCHPITIRIPKSKIRNPL